MSGLKNGFEGIPKSRIGVIVVLGFELQQHQGRWIGVVAERKKKNPRRDHNLW